MFTKSFKFDIIHYSESSEFIYKKEFIMKNNINLNAKIKPKTFCISTFGCQMNEEDSEKLSGMLKRIGYERTENKRRSIYNNI